MANKHLFVFDIGWVNDIIKDQYTFLRYLAVIDIELIIQDCMERLFSKSVAIDLMQQWDKYLIGYVDPDERLGLEDTLETIRDDVEVLLKEILDNLSIHAEHRIAQQSIDGLKVRRITSEFILCEGHFND